MEKYYVLTEGDIRHIERDDDNTIDELVGHSSMEFNNKDEVIDFLLREKLSDDGQVYRFIKTLVPFLLNSIEEEVMDESDNELYKDYNKEDWFASIDLCEMFIKTIKENKQSMKQILKKEKKEFELQEKIGLI